MLKIARGFFTYILVECTRCSSSRLVSELRVVNTAGHPRWKFEWCSLTKAVCSKQPRALDCTSVNHCCFIVMSRIRIAKLLVLAVNKETIYTVSARHGNPRGFWRHSSRILTLAALFQFLPFPFNLNCRIT